MKNIHLIPTDKPSRFSLNSSGKYHLTNQLHTNSPNFTAQNIYITSDEEIKEGDWFYSPFQNEERILKYNKFVIPFPKDKKIILTTDQDLIKNGIQAINDEFLEWYVKNPSCEEVEVEPDYDEIRGDYYKIIIPKEEPKQETLEEFKKRFANDESHKNIKLDYQDGIYYGIEIGAKWQQERRYSEGEVLQLLLKLQQTESYDNLYDWFEQFKKIRS